MKDGVFVSIDPHKLDDAELNRELEQAMAQIAPADLEKAAETPRRGGQSGGGGRRHRQHERQRSEERTRIPGTVVGIRGTDVFVDIGGKSEGFLPLDEFEPDHPPQVGQALELIPHGFDNDSGLMRLSLRETAVGADLNSLKPGDVVKAKVTGTNIGGLELRIHGLRGFMPVSQIDMNRVEDMAPFMNHWLECEVSEIDRRGKNVILSRRRLLDRQREEDRKRLREELSEGQVRKGVVRRLADFGAFVDIGGIDGLLHVSDMSYSRVAHPSQVLKVGDEIEVKVLKIDSGRDRISLGMKQMGADPWTLVGTNYTPGTTVEGRVVKLMDFGAFVELEAGIEGLIPISEMSWTQRVRHPKDVLNEGDNVRVSILAVDPGQRRISLSLKALAADPWATIPERYPENAVVSGAVTRITNFGAFVQLEEGVEGLVHISELSDKRINRVDEVVKPGAVVQVRVLAVDPAQRRVSLSMKSTSPKADDAAMADAQLAEAALGAAKPGKKKKERPLRGGLSW